MTATVGIGGIVGMGNGVGVGSGVAVALDATAARLHAESSSIAKSSVTQRNIGMGRIKHASYGVTARANTASSRSSAYMTEADALSVEELKKAIVALACYFSRTTLWHGTCPCSEDARRNEARRTIAHGKEKRTMSNDQWNDNRDDERDDDQDEDLGARGDKDTVRGKVNQAAGNVQEKAGDILNNDEMQRHGQEKQIKGKLQEGAGDVERKADDILGDDDDH
jgi:uncharacterized protein YjbJ (UPF0337 family)